MLVIFPLILLVKEHFQNNYNWNLFKMNKIPRVSFCLFLYILNCLALISASGLWHSAGCLCTAVCSACTSSVTHLCWEWTAVSTSTLYSTSAHRQAKNLKFVYQIVYAVILSGMFFLLNGPKASNHLLHRTSVWEHWWRMKKPGKL